MAECPIPLKKWLSNFDLLSHLFAFSHGLITMDMDVGIFFVQVLISSKWMLTSTCVCMLGNGAGTGVAWALKKSKPKKNLQRSLGRRGTAREAANREAEEDGGRMTSSGLYSVNFSLERKHDSVLF